MSESTKHSFLKPGQYADASEWRQDFLREYYELLADTVPENIDRFRFPEQRDDLFIPSWHHREFVTLLANLDAAFSSRSIFSDDASRALFDRLLLYRVLGPTHVKLPLRSKFKLLEAKTLETIGRASNCLPGAALDLVDVSALGHRFHVECLPINVLQTFGVRQYYVERPDLSIAVKTGDHVVDVGACFGDTALLFAHSVGPNGRVYAFEMVPEHLRIIARNLERNPCLAPRISVFGAALGDVSIEGVQSPMGTLQDSKKVDPGARYDASLAPCWRLDDVVDQGLIERVDFLKLDVEGAEPRVLSGAARTIARNRPVLAISAYHSMVDFIHLPCKIAALDLDYNIHLEHYTIHAEESVLFAVPKSNGSSATLFSHSQAKAGGSNSLGDLEDKVGKLLPLGRKEEATASYWQARQQETELELRALRTDITRLSDNARENEQEAENWRSAHGAVMREAEALRAEIAELTVNVSYQKTQATNWQQAHQDVAKEANSLRAYVEQLTANVSYQTTQATNWQHAHQNIAREADALRARVEQLQESVTEHVRQVEILQQERDDKARDAEMKQVRIVELEAEVTRIAQDASLAKVGNIAAMREIDGLKVAAQTREEEITRLREEARTGKMEFQKLQEEFWALETERDEIQLDLGKVTEEFQAIQSSTIWRGTAVVRGYLGRRPRIKRFARRAAKLAWWTASGQLFSQLRARKARQNTAAASIEPRSQPLQAGAVKEAPATVVPAVVEAQGIEPWSDALPMISVIVSDLLEARREALTAQLARTVPRYELLAMVRANSTSTRAMAEINHPNVRLCKVPIEIESDADGDFAIGRAFGKYVCFLTPHDDLADDYFARAIEQLEQSRADCAICHTSSPLITPDTGEFLVPPVYRRSALARLCEEKRFGCQDARRSCFGAALTTTRFASSQT